MVKVPHKFNKLLEVLVYLIDSKHLTNQIVLPMVIYQ